MNAPTATLIKETTKTEEEILEEERQEPEPAPKEKERGGMHVRKRDGRLEPADINKIVKAVERHCAGLPGAEPLRVAQKTISGLQDGSTTAELDAISIRAAADLIAEDPDYSKLSARLLATYVAKEVEMQDIHSFSQSVAASAKHGLINEETAEFVAKNSRKLNQAVVSGRDSLFEFFGMRVLYDRYLLRNPKERIVTETPQYMFMRVACGLSHTAEEAIRFYDLMSALEYLPSSPTLFNSGTSHPQMSSCYLLDSPEDDLKAIYDRYTDIALLSKHAGGIGISYSRVRSTGSLIKGTNGFSNGIVPWLKTLDSSVSAVNQGGRRKGAACVYLESWHADIEEFLDLKDNTGDQARRSHNLNIANWVPDLFMERVSEDGTWSLFDPKKVPHLPDLHGEEFALAYTAAEEERLWEKQVSAQDLYRKMMRTLAQTGNGWMCFKDAANSKSNQTLMGNNSVHLSNLCTEILEVTARDEIAVCNLGSVNVSALVKNRELDWDRLGEIVEEAILFLDKVVDINFYPLEDAGGSNRKWRPVGLGLMGLQDVFFKMGLPFDSEEARSVSREISETVYYHALSASCDLAEIYGPHPSWAETRASKGRLQHDLWGVQDEDLSEPQKWEDLRMRIKTHGLRNSLMLAIAPTATIASIAGCYECIEPQLSNLFKRETLSGEFLQINNYLVRDLQEMGLWDEAMLVALKQSEGSVQSIDGIPEETKAVYRTAWEMPMRSLIDMAADRGPFIDQSQSLNLFMESPTVPKLSSMYLHAWKSGLKTTYYLRSRAATKIAKATVGAERRVGDGQAVCSLENPETCEACQ